jgi:hypothetical protein
VTKPTGKPRGRPPKHRLVAAPRPAHRPKKTLYDDPDRMHLAVIVAFVHSGMSEKQASEKVALSQRVELVDVTDVSELGLTPRQIAALKPRQRTRPIVEVAVRKGSTTSIRNHARALAMKLNRYHKDPAARLWLKAMAGMLHAAFDEPDLRAKARLLNRAYANDSALAVWVKKRHPATPISG